MQYYKCHNNFQQFGLRTPQEEHWGGLRKEASQLKAMAEQAPSGIRRTLFWSDLLQIGFFVMDAIWGPTLFHTHAAPWYLKSFTKTFTRHTIRAAVRVNMCKINRYSWSILGRRVCIGMWCMYVTPHFRKENCRGLQPLCFALHCQQHHELISDSYAWMLKMRFIPWVFPPKQQCLKVDGSYQVMVSLSASNNLTIPSVHEE